MPPLFVLAPPCVVVVPPFVLVLPPWVPPAVEPPLPELPTAPPVVEAPPGFAEPPAPLGLPAGLPQAASASANETPPSTTGRDQARECRALGSRSFRWLVLSKSSIG
jgi:hypothetical protein